MPRAHGLRLRRRRVEHPDAHRGALVDERGIRAHRLPGAGQRDRLGEREAVLPDGEPAALQTRGGRRELRPQPWADLLAQRLEVAPRRKDLVVGALDLEAHPQVVGEPVRSQASAGTRTLRTSASTRVTSSRSGARRGSSRSSTCPTTSGTGTSGRRRSFGSPRSSAVSSSRRRAGTSHSNRSGRTAPRRRSGTCAVTPSSRRPRLEAVGQLELDLALAPGRRPAAPREPVRGRGVDEQLARVREEVRVRAARVAPPAVEVVTGDDARRAPARRRSRRGPGRRRGCRGGGRGPPAPRSPPAPSRWRRRSAWRVAQSRSTSALRMNSSRDITGSMRP